MILWEQPSPKIAANLHASEKGFIAFEVLPTGSMEPYLTGGDWVVIDSLFPFDKITEGDVAVYSAAWLVGGPLVIHQCAARSGDSWIMSGIANHNYENAINGLGGMTRDRYRGKLVQVYTKRAKQ